ncbi:hypothetical protein WJX79_000367 [Trebouxia sp. C0005]
MDPLGLVHCPHLAVSHTLWIAAAKLCNRINGTLLAMGGTMQRLSLAAQLALEHTVHLEGLSLHQAQALQQLCASTYAAIELAQQRVQDCNAQSGIIKYASLRRTQPVEQKFSEVTEQLNELAQQAWNLQREAVSTPAGYQEDMKTTGLLIAFKLDINAIR